MPNTADNYRLIGVGLLSSWTIRLFFSLSVITLGVAIGPIRLFFFFAILAFFGYRTISTRAIELDQAFEKSIGHLGDLAAEVLCHDNLIERETASLRLLAELFDTVREFIPASLLQLLPANPKTSLIACGVAVGDFAKQQAFDFSKVKLAKTPATFRIPAITVARALWFLGFVSYPVLLITVCFVVSNGEWTIKEIAAFIEPSASAPTDNYNAIAIYLYGSAFVFMIFWGVRQLFLSDAVRRLGAVRDYLEPESSHWILKLIFFGLIPVAITSSLLGITNFWWPTFCLMISNFLIGIGVVVDAKSFKELLLEKRAAVDGDRLLPVHRQLCHVDFAKAKHLFRSFLLTFCAIRTRWKFVLFVTTGSSLTLSMFSLAKETIAEQDVSDYTSYLFVAFLLAYIFAVVWLVDPIMTSLFSNETNWPSWRRFLGFLLLIIVWLGPAYIVILTGDQLASLVDWNSSAILGFGLIQQSGIALLAIGGCWILKSSYRTGS